MDFVISEGYKREGRGVTDIGENPYRGLYPRRGLYARVYGTILKIYFMVLILFTKSISHVVLLVLTYPRQLRHWNTAMKCIKYDIDYWQPFFKFPAVWMIIQKWEFV